MWYEFNGLYLAVNLGCLALPLLLSFDKNVQFYKHWKYFFRVNLSVAAFFIVWDAIFTKMGIWAFNSDYLLGPSILGLPFEELLFFVCIPYCSVFTYFTLQHYVKRNPLKHAETTLTISAILFCAALVVVFFPRNYISLTSLFTLAWLVWAQRNAKPFMADLWLAFFVLLVPVVLGKALHPQRRCFHHGPNRLVPPGAQHRLANLHDARR